MQNNCWNIRAQTFHNKTGANLYL